MSIENINIEDILVDDSRFAMKNFLFEPGPGLSCHINSFEAVGILYPIIVYRDYRNHLHLVDGKKRIQYARDRHEKSMRATVLAPSTPVLDIIVLGLCNQMNIIESSVMNKVLFICYASSLNTPESWIMKTLCIAFEFKPHRDFLRECERIYNLPKALKLFCHEKKISLKQLLNLSYHRVDILKQIVKWLPVLHFTASTLDEIASKLSDYLKRENMTLSAFLKDTEVEELLESSLSPREKTEKLRALIHFRQFPVLSESNRKLKSIAAGLHLPKEIQISWDSTLENKNINLSVNISDPAKWSKLLETLSTEDTRKAIESILDEL
jgi:hypothetical protein